MSQADGTIEHQALVSPSDTVDLPNGQTTGIAVNVAGDVKMTMRSGATVTRYLVAGIDYPYRVQRVWDTDTDAEGIHTLHF